jgi:outer membrane murein-binding lipoprotein Lpp
MASQQPSATIKRLQDLVRAEVRKMLFVFVCVLGIVAFGHDFVLHGILSNVFLNGGIIAIFIFGTVLCFQRVLSVRNDALAFGALEEACDDLRSERVDRLDDPYWRHYRAMEPGIVFQSPKSIGQMFGLAYDEILKTRNLQISVGTLGNIVAAIESRQSESRSLINYLTGLLIFLGLIGTFIGLMEMVGSIGGVMSGLTAATSNSTEAMQRLLTDLQKPLSGMAMGFSSSLFGLFGSLALGIMARFCIRAQNGLKETFAAWLGNVASLETGRAGEVGDLARLIADNIMGTGDQVMAGNGRSGPVVSDVGMVATMAQGFGRMQASLEALGNAMPKLIEVQNEQLATTRLLIASVDRLTADVSDMRDSLRTTVAGGAQSNESLQEMINLSRTTEQRLTSGFNGMAHVMEVTGQAYLDGLRRLTAENYETNARLAKLLDVKAAGDKITEIVGSIESKVKGGVGSVTHAMDRTANALETGMQKLAAEQADLKNALLQMQANAAAGGGVSAEFENRLTAGFTELSRSMETVFAAYAQIVNRSLVASAMGQGEAMPEGSAIAGAARSAVPEREARPQPKPDIDHEVLRRRLYSVAHQAMRDTGTT